MMSLELPHLTVLSKCDLVEDKVNLSKFLNADYKQKRVNFDDVSHIEKFRLETQEPEKESRFGARFQKLTQSIKQIVAPANPGRRLLAGLHARARHERRRHHHRHHLPLR